VTTSTSTSTSTDTATDTATATDTGSTGTDTDTTATETEEGGVSFYAGPDVDFGSFNTCDPWMQDCPEGEKCVPYAAESNNFDSNKCVPVMGDMPVGESCTATGPIESTDDCDDSGYCFFVADGVGTCQGFCEQSPDDPVCPQAGDSCLIDGDGSVALCVQGCDPMDPELPECPDGSTCTSLGADGLFFCTPN